MAANKAILLTLFSEQPVRRIGELVQAFGRACIPPLIELEEERSLFIYRHVEDVDGLVRERAALRSDDTVYVRRRREPIRRKTLLYRSKAALEGYALNHVEGCSHGCRYPCYAMLMKRRFDRIRSYLDWLSPRIVANAPSLLEAELARLGSEQVDRVTMSLTCDPFMYGELDVEQASLGLIDILNRGGVPVTVLTKGILPSHLPVAAAGGRRNRYGVSLVSLNENFRRKYEPFSAPYDERLAALRRLHDAGAGTWVCMEPYPPPTVAEPNLEELLEAVSFVDQLYFGKWNYGGAETRGRENQGFYSRALGDVIAACERRGIECRAKSSEGPGSHVCDSP